MRVLSIAVIFVLVLAIPSAYCQQSAGVQTAPTKAKVSPEGQKDRKGFVVGLGLGPSYTTYTMTNGSVTSERQNKVGINTDFKIGYAFSNQVMVYWMSKVSWYKEELASRGYYDPYRYAYLMSVKEVTVTNGMGGAAVTYFFKAWAPSPFVFAGLGYSALSTPFDDYDASYGLGLTVGGGFEFVRHFCFEGSLVYGSPKDAGITMNSLSFKITLNWLGY